MPKIRVNGINIYYEIYGNGFPFVMINGQSGTVNSFKSLKLIFNQFISLFSKDFKTILFDKRGIGQTDDIDKQYTIKTLADDVVGLMENLNLEKANIIGFSMGGLIAQELMINYPEKIEKSVIGATHYGMSRYIMPSEEVTNIMMRNQEGLSPEEIVKSQISLAYTEKFIKNNLNFIDTIIQNYISNPITPEAYQKQINAILRFNSSRRLKKVQLPTLVLHGRHDLLVPVRNAEILAELIHGTKLRIFENSAHTLLIEEPVEVLNEILNFLK
ncbi:MAG: alpha/beta fold hydrolase [Candidatus Odinarchaeota archaeon]